MHRYSRKHARVASWKETQGWMSSLEKSGEIRWECQIGTHTHTHTRTHAHTAKHTATDNESCQTLSSLLISCNRDSEGSFPLQPGVERGFTQRAEQQQRWTDRESEEGERIERRDRERVRDSPVGGNKRETQKACCVHTNNRLIQKRNVVTCPARDTPQPRSDKHAVTCTHTHKHHMQD